MFICSHLYSPTCTARFLTAPLHHDCRAGAVGVQHLELFCGPALGHGQVAAVRVPAQCLCLQARKQEMWLWSRDTAPALTPELPEHLLCSGCSRMA